MKTKDNECMFCKAKQDNLTKFKVCGSHICNGCLESFRDKGEKTFECKHCTVRHLVNKRTVDPTRVTKKPAQRAPRGMWIFMPPGETPRDLPKNASKAKRASQRSRIVPASFNRHPFVVKKASNTLKPTKTFKIDKVNTDPKEQMLMFPIFEDKLLFIKSNREYFLLNQDNQVCKSGTFKQPGEICTVKVNSKYIYVLSVTSAKRDNTFIYQYDHEFNFIEELLMDSPCAGMACSDDKFFYSTIFGSEWNPHPMTLVLDADDFDDLDRISYEVDDREEKYYCEKLSDPPRVHVFQDKVYFFYPDCDRIDYVDNDSLDYITQFDVPEWFFNFRIDHANGNFVCIDFDKSTICIYDNKKLKLVKKLTLSAKLNKEDPFDFCITNDGHLVLFKNATTVEIY